MHPEDEDLELYYLLRFSPHQITAIESHVLECDFCQSKIQALEHSLHDRGNNASERIHDKGISLRATRSIHVLERSATLTGQILDISGNTMKLNLSEFLYPGVFIQTRIGTRMITGQARYCAHIGQEFHVGVEIESIFVVTSKGQSGEDPRSTDN